MSPDPPNNHLHGPERASSSDLTGMASSEEEEDNFGYDERTDGKNGSERSDRDDSIFKSPSPPGPLFCSKRSILSPADLGTLQTRPS